MSADKAFSKIISSLYELIETDDAYISEDDKADFREYLEEFQEYRQNRITRMFEDVNSDNMMLIKSGKTYEANFIGEPFHLGLSKYYEGEDFLGYPVYRYTLDFYPTYTQEIVKPENVIDIPEESLPDDWTTWPW